MAQFRLEFPADFIASANAKRELLWVPLFDLELFENRSRSRSALNLRVNTNSTQLGLHEDGGQRRIDVE